MNIDNLYKAWERWDNQPASRDAVIRLQVQITLAATELGCTSNEFLDLVGKLRGRNQDLRAALERAVELFSD